MKRSAGNLKMIRHAKGPLALLVLAALWISCGHKLNPVGSNDAGQSQPARLTGSPYPMSQRPDTLYVVDESNLTYSQILTVESLQGILAQTKPEIYVVNGNDSYSNWLSDLEMNYGVDADYTYSKDFPGLLSHFKSRITGYILTNTTEPSIDVAISLAGLKDAIVVAGVDEPTVKGLGIPELQDVTGENYEQFINEYASQENKNVICYQSAASEKAQFLLDYAVFSRASFFYDNISSPLYDKMLAGMNQNSALLGWGSSEYDLVNTASQYGVMVHAADFAKDLSVLSNFGAATVQATHDTDPEVIDSVHTVCFVMTDGDNIQWLLNSFSTNTSWYGSPDRGHVDIGWTISPALAELAPTVMHKFYQAEGKSQGGRDYFIAGVSGLGYVYPESYKGLDSYASLTASFMKKADLTIVNILGNSNPPSVPVDYLSPFLKQGQIGAVFYYFYSNYSGGNGEIVWVDGKPVITGRYNLWSPQFETPQSLATKLNAASTDIHSPAGYSLIPVHVWSHTVDDVIKCVTLLNKNVRVVAPDEFVSLIEKNIKH